MLHGYVISDLHLFAERSVARSYFQAMSAAAERADFFVLNGDIFDFRWTTLSGVEETIFAAVDWLGDLSRRFPRCRFFHIMGNHDGCRRFVEHLTERQAQAPNLQWRLSHLRLGSALFLHGDLPLRRRRTKAFTRLPARTPRRKGPTWNRAFRLAEAAGFFRHAARIHRPRRCAQRILRALRSDQTGLADGVTDVYFGHTHGPFVDYRYDGVTFHNTGSAVRGLRCAPLTVRARNVRDVDWS